MAKLTGVKVLDMTGGEITRISYEGEEYVNVGKRGGHDGDIGLRTDDAPYARAGEFYPIISEGGRLCFKDDEGDTPYVHEELENFEFFRKVSAPSHEERITDLETRVDKLEESEDTTKLKTVDRDAKVGERILITNKYHEEDRYDNGDILTARLVDCDGDVTTKDDMFILRGEYEVVVEEDDSGNTYDKPARVGDTIRITDVHWTCVSNYRNGDIMTVEKVDEDGDITRTNKYSGFIIGEEYEIIGRDSRGQFENGDKVRLISGGDRYPLRGFEDGKVYEVKDVETTYHSGRRIEITDRGVLEGYALPSQLEKVEESAPKLAVGDYAKVVGVTHYNDIKRDSYVKITDDVDRDGDYRIDLLDEIDYDYAKPESLEKVELTDEDLAFLKIGRKLGEFKDGDIVRITANTNFSANKVGDIGIIKGNGRINPIVLVNGRGGGQHLSHTEKDEMELIAPVESRVDLDE